MSKSLKKLIDINRLREFKNKLVGADSAYVQTGAVDQTVAGTKAFSKPIVGSVTGSSGSCTGNAATATKLATARTINGTAFNGTANITTANWGTARNISITDGTNTSTAVSVNGSVNVSLNLPDTIKANLTGNSDTATKATQDSAGQQIDTTYIKGLAVSGRTITYTKGDGTTGTITTQDTNTDTKVTQTVTTTNAEYPVLFSADANKTTTSTTTAGFSSNIKINPSTNTITATTFKGNCSGSSGSCTGNAATATKATGNANGKELTNTIIKGLSISGKTITYTQIDGNTGTLTTQDTVYTHPTTAGNKHIPSGGSSGQFLGWASDGTAKWVNNPNTNTDTLMTQNVSTTNATYPVLLVATANATANQGAKTGIFAKSVKVNPSTNVISASGFSGPLTGNVTGNCSGSSGSCTGNAATATKAVSADSATNASHATSADKATKAEQDGNGNNIVASYVAAGSEDSTTDIGAFMAARPSFIKSFVYNNVWTDAISMRHRNGSGDGCNFGTYIRSSNMTGFSNLLWNHQCGNWQGERTLIDSANLAGFVKSGITIYDLVPDGAEAHNAMWGGRDITAAFNAGTVSANIANGTFKDIFPGDYITKQVTISGTTYNVNWVIADCDYWINKGGQSSMGAHHVVIVPQTPIFSARMNSANTTEGGYKGSEMYRSVIPACATGIVNAFGASHIPVFGDGITNSVDTSHVSSGIPQWTGTPGWWGEWVSVRCNLMSEKMVYGAPICAAGAMDNSVATRQMSAFRLSERLINYNRQVWWLRDVVSSASFAVVDVAGSASTYNASDSRGVRPFALLR